MRMPYVAPLVLALCCPLLVQAAEPEADEAWWKNLPQLGAAVEAGVAAVLLEDGQGRGQHDVSESGFVFRYAQLAIKGDWFDHFGIDTRATVDLEGFNLERAWAQVHGLPWDLTIRAGWLPGRAGFANARGASNGMFLDQPLALGKLYGPMGQVAVGTDLAFTIPAPWTLTLYAAMSAAEGPGMRSFFGDRHVKPEGLEDFAYQLGLENIWQAGGLQWELEFAAHLGPNGTGRGNAADVFATAFALRLPALKDHEVSLDLETEWFVRRRQFPGSNLMDWGGWLATIVTVERDWQIGARYEVTNGVGADPLDPSDSGMRHRVTAQLGWRPYRFGLIRLAGAVDTGGPLQDRSFSLQLMFRAGWEVSSWGGMP